MHAFPSLQELPSDFAGFEQTPVVVLQVPAVWHWSGVGHPTAVPAQAPLLSHKSFSVHAFPSLQLAPVAVLQVLVLVPGVHCWHWFAGFVAPLA